MSYRLAPLALLLVALAGMWGCEDTSPAAVDETAKAWDQERLDSLRMPGVVEVPGDIYKRAYERALMQIDTSNMEERLAALEKEIEREREELR